MDDQQELFIVVNKQDKVLGFHTRYDCHHDKKLIHRAIGIVVFNDRGEVLLQKRSRLKDTYPGFYTMACSGHVNKGEAYKVAAKRELEEELGVKLPLTKKMKFLLEMLDETEMDCIFTARYNGPFYPNSLEVEDVKFVTKRELKKMKKLLTPFAKYTFERMNLL